MKIGNKTSKEKSSLSIVREIKVIESQNLSPDLAQDETGDMQNQQHKRFKRSLWFWSIFSLVLGIGGFILSLPPIMTCGNAARNSEGRHFVGAINRGQSTFWLDNGKLAQKLPDLQVGISDTNRYSYKISIKTNVAYHYGIAKKENLKNFVGAVFILPENSPAFTLNDSTKPIAASSNIPSEASLSHNWLNNLQQWNLIPETQKLMPFAILCETQDVGISSEIPQPFLEKGIPTCGKGTNKIS